MPTPPSDDTRTLFRLIADGEWHEYEEIRAKIAASVPPGRALRKYEERVEYKRKYKNDPAYDTAVGEDERIHYGAKACAQVVITSWKGRGLQSREVAGRKWIRIRPGFVSWGLEKEGIPGPGAGGSEPSESAGEPSEEPARPEPAVPAPEAPESVAAEPAMGVLHPSHVTMFDESRFVTTCRLCGQMVVSSGEYGGVTPAGKEVCKAASAGEREEAIDIPAMEMISEAESAFTLKVYSPEGEKSFKKAIDRASRQAALREEAEMLLNRPPNGLQRTVWDPRERRLRPATEEELAAVSGLLSQKEEPATEAEDAAVTALLTNYRPAPFEVATPEEMTALAEQIEKEGQPSAAEVVWSDSARDVEPTSANDWFGQSPTVAVQRSVTEQPEPPQAVLPIPDGMPGTQGPEMALFNESEVRHLVQEEIEKSLDAFQLGMEQYLNQQFEQLSLQIAELKAVRGKWVYHPQGD